VNFAKEATKIMLGLDIKSELMKDLNMIGVKVPQFSFHRLKGADINLGVEMISTGEVACFGENKYEAFLKGIISTGFRLPKRGSNILLSIGSYKFKKEFTQSVNTLQELGFNLYGTFGTTDFYVEKGIKLTQLPLSSSDDEVKTIHRSLATREIDLVINVSTKNKMRSDETNPTNGYVIRRLAIENNIPIMTDIKFAKLFVSSLKFYMEDLGSKLPIRSGIDCFTSYKIVKLPGLIDVHVHIREPGNSYKEDWTSGTQAALAGGITMICNMPNTDPPITTRESFDLISKIAKEKACCDYGIYVGASSQNTDTVSQLSNASVGLKMYLNNTYGPLLLNSTLDWIEHIKNWPDNRPLCVHAESKTLAAILHIANLYKKKIHVCHVATREEIELIKQSKLAGMQITCEVAPHHLFITHEHNCIQDGCTDVKPPLASNDDQQALWENMNYIDCFATDHAPHTVDDKLKTKCPGFPGLETALPLLLTAVKHGRLTVDDIVQKYHHNPKKIFGLPSQPDTYIEVDLDKEWLLPQNMKYSKCGWTPFANTKVCGLVRRVVLRGKVVYVDGEVLAKPGYGVNVRESPTETNLPILPTTPRMITLFDSREFSEATEDDDVTIDPDVHLHNVVTVEQFDRDLLRVIFKRASDMKHLVKKNGRLDLLKDKILASIFYEPSTRTRCSFTAAMKRLGGEVVEISADVSSVQKGESLEDFLRSMECYADIIVMRSSEEDSTDRALRVLNKPFINAGNGIGEHPTQALLDAYTIRDERGSITDSTITLLGDLKHGRTVHSLAKLLSQYQNIRFRYVSPPGLEMPDHIQKYIGAKGIEQTNHHNIMEVLETTDILYVTRIQKERFRSEREYEAVKGSYIIDHKVLARAKSDLVVMHPLPRVDEISTEIDSDARAAYYRQIENGMYVRMALLSMIFGR
jgi:carbamoyl-phosphate synthase/aspartate carbamoyltransferase/dihydroorotase